jgi:putative oxidoreductase
MKYTVLIGRILFAVIFLMAAPGHFKTGTIHYAAAQGVPIASVLVPISGILAFLGGLSLLLGFKARWGAVLLLLFLVPVTLAMHAFWAVKDPGMAQMQQIMFMKNVAMVGAALIVVHFGSGPLSVDSWLESRRHAPTPAEEPAPA